MDNKTIITPKQKREARKEKFLKAKNVYEKYLEKRKTELGNLLIKIDETIGDYSDNILKPYFQEMIKKIKHEN